MDIVETNVGPESKVKVNFNNGNLVITVAYDGEGLDGSLSLTVDAGYLIDQLEKAIPGTLDDTVLGLIKAALGK